MGRALPRSWTFRGLGRTYLLLRRSTAGIGNEPAAKKVERPAEPKQTDTEPKPVLEPWPPETLAFAGKKAGEEWSANGLRMKFCWCPAGTFTDGQPQG